MLNRSVIFMLISIFVFAAYSQGQNQKELPKFEKTPEFRELEKERHDYILIHGEKAYEDLMIKLREKYGLPKTDLEIFKESLEPPPSKVFGAFRSNSSIEKPSQSEISILKGPKSPTYSILKSSRDFFKLNSELDKDIENQIKERPSSFQADPDRFRRDTRSSANKKVLYDCYGECTCIISSKAEDEGDFYFWMVQKNHSGDGFEVIMDQPLSLYDISTFFDLSYQTRISEKTTDDINIIHAGTILNNEFPLQIGKTKETIQMPKDETNRDEELINEICSRIVQHCRSNDIIITRDIFARDIPDVTVSSLIIENDFKSFKSQRLNPLYLIEQLQIKFPDKRFYLGGDLDKDISAIRSLPEVNSPSDISAFTAPKSLDIKYDLMAKEYVRNNLTQNDIKIIDLDKPEEKSEDLNSKIIFITGNKDEKMAAYLDKLSKEPNIKDKTVIIFSCGEKGDDHLNSSFISESKANSTISFPTKTNPDAIMEVIMKFSELVGNKTNSKSIYELLNQAIEEAAIECKDDAFLKDEIDKLRKFIQQTSFEYNPEKDQVITNS